MSAAPALRASKPFEGGQLDRVHPRYPVTLESQYKLVGIDGLQHSGAGRTLNVSRDGILFETYDRLSASAILRCRGIIELSVDWPSIAGNLPLKLTLRGRIVRTDGSRLAIKVEYPGFSTSGLGSAVRTEYPGACAG